MLGAVVAWSLYTSLLRLRPTVHPSSFLAATFAIGVVTMLPLACLEWRAIAAIRWRPEIFGAFAYVAVLPSVVAYRLYNHAVAKIGAARAGQTISLMPLFGALLAAPLLHESLHGYHVAGMILILGGIAITVWLNGRAGGPARRVADPRRSRKPSTSRRISLIRHPCHLSSTSRTRSLASPGAGACWRRMRAIPASRPTIW